MYLVSACLAGEKCRMDGKDKLIPEIRRLVEEGKATPVCPEVLGGLPTPRSPSEKRGDRVVNGAGKDVTEQFRRGAEESMRICRESGCTMAILKSKSPSCGYKVIHNGLFDGGLMEGNGVLTQMLLDTGIAVMTETEYLKLSGLKYIRLRASDTDEYQKAMELYRQSFPLHEQRENDSQREIMLNEAYHFVRIVAAESFVGCILYWETSDFIYAEHFFVAPEHRNQGYGRRVLQWITAQGKPVILEIDPPEDEESKRRKGFYERSGFVENAFHHVHPPYHSGIAGHELVVMSYPASISESLYQPFVRYLRDVVMK